MNAKMSNWVRVFPLFLLLVVMTACGNSSRKAKKDQIKYEIRKVEPETRVYNIYIPASLHGLSEVEVYPQVSGIIREVNFKDGFKVKKGQALFVIDQTEHKLNVQNAQANLAAAKAQMETTKLKYESNQKLAEQRIISDYVLSSSMNAYHVAQASVQQAQAQLAMAQTHLGYCTVRSPITGIIKENGFKIGELADLSNLLCTVSDDSEIQAWFSYTESQLLELLDQYNLKPSSEGLKDIDGKSVSAKLPRLKLQLKNGQEYAHEGVVTEMGGIVDRKTGTVICKATFPNPDYELRSGLSATLVFPIQMDEVFRVPKTAAVHLQNHLMFYRVSKDGTVEGVICEAIPSNSGQNYYVKSGLHSGDEIVINGVQNLSNGMKVR